jgi:hypothetical protein
MVWKDMHVVGRLTASAVAVAALCWTDPEVSADERPAHHGAAPVQGTAESAGPVLITDHSAYWANVMGIGVDGECVQNAGLLVIRGEVHNGTGFELGHVKLAFELLDDAGNVVAAEEGYNRNSEMLRPIESPIPWHIQDPPHVPIPKDGSDSFRMLFVRSEMPPFSTYRIRVLESAGQ